MKIKSKFNFYIGLILILAVFPLFFNIFGLYKISCFRVMNEQADDLSVLFNKQYLLVGEYSSALLEDYSQTKDEKISNIEKEFSDLDGKIALLLEQMESDPAFSAHHLQSTRSARDKIDDSFKNIKAKHLSVVTEKESRSSYLETLSEKRKRIERLILKPDPSNSTSSDDYLSFAVSGYGDLADMETSFTSNPNSESLKKIKLFLSDFKGQLESKIVLDDYSESREAFADYSNELDIYYSGLSDNEEGLLSINASIAGLNDYIYGFLDSDGEGIGGLKKDLEEKSYFYLQLLNFLNISFGILLLGLVFVFWRDLQKKIIKPLIGIKEFAAGISGQKKDRKLNIEANNEIGDLAASLSGLEEKLEKSNKSLLQKIDELKLKENVESLVHALTDGVIMYDKNKNIVLKNSAVIDILGLDAENIRLKNLYGVFAKQNLEFHIDMSLRSDEVYKIKNVDIHGLKYELLVSQVSNQQGSILGGLIIFHKTNTEKKHSQTKSNVDISSILSPHFRSPLSYIKLFSETLLEEKTGSLNEEQKQFIRNIRSSVLGMKEIIDKLQESHLIDNGEFEIKTEEVDFPLLLKDLVKKYGEEKDVSRIDFIFKSQLSDDIKINIDKNIFQRVFFSILDNAIVYSNSNRPYVEIELKELGLNYLLSVRDNGIGIPEDEQDSVFEKFFRAGNTLDRNPAGAGINLHIAKKFLNSTGVEIFFESKAGEGTSFFVEIPKGGMRR